MISIKVPHAQIHPCSTSSQIALDVKPEILSFEESSFTAPGSDGEINNDHLILGALEPS